MKKKVLAFLLASTMVIEPFSVAGAADFSDGTGQEADMQFSDDAEDVPEVKNDVDGVDQFSTDVAGDGESSSKQSEDAIQMGDDVWFRFDESTGTATISGTGDMWDYYTDGYDKSGSHKNPFIGMNQTSVKNIIIENGITSVGNYFLYEYAGVEREDTNVISNIILGKDIKRIGDYAFTYCYNVEDIVLPEGLEEIGENAFGVCGNIKEIVIPDSIKILGKSCFSKCRRLSSVIFPDNLESISDNAFSGCGISELNLPLQLKYIGNNAFSGNNLKKIKMSSNIEYIGNSAFWGCGISEINLPKSIKKIGASAFYNCTDLTTIKFEEGIACDIPQYMFGNCVKLNKITIPNTIQKIEGCAFDNCFRLTTIMVEGELTQVASKAFIGCSNISVVKGCDCSYIKQFYNSLSEDQKEQITFESLGEGSHQFTAEKVQIKEATCTEKGSKAYRCEICGKIEAEEEIPVLGHNWDSGIITKPATETEEGVRTYTCRRCNETKTESIPKISKQEDTLKVTGKSVEWNDYSTVELTFLSNVKGTYYIKTVNRGEKAPTVDISQVGTPIEANIDVIATVTDIPDYDVDIYVCVISDVDKNNYGSVMFQPISAERPQKTIKTIKVGDNATATVDGDTITITGVGETYDECYWADGNSVLNKDNIKHIVIEDGITSLGYELFYNFKNVEIIQLPTSLTKIKNRTFQNCRSLLNISIPEGVTEIGIGIFNNCVSLKSIMFPSTLKEIPDITDCEDSELVPVESITLKNGIQSIGFEAFGELSELKNINIPDSVTIIKESAFADCTTLSNVSLPDSITEIEYNAFGNCESLDRIVLPKNITSLGNAVFRNCNVEITFPASLKYIPYLGDNAVKKVTISEGVETIGADAFLNSYKLTEITLPSTITSIESGAFSGTGITSFNYPQNFTSIAAGVFQNTNLKEFSVPEKVTEINEVAFSNCINMTRISIPKSVTYIGTDAFKYCKNLTIYGYKDSAAESYAKANNIKFVSADYSVVFKDNGRTKKIQYVLKGGNATPPTLSSKPGYTLSWDADYTNITEDMVINAVWTKKDNGSGGGTTIIVSPSETTKYTVTFKDRGEVVKTEKVKSGEAAEYPFITRSGYKLSWDKDFSKITADTTVNAVWTVIKPEKVTSLTAEIGKSSIDLSWDETEFAGYYLVYRKADSEKEYTQVAKTTKIIWTDSKTVPGTQYSYKVVAVRSVEGKKYQGEDSDIVTAKIGTPQVGDIYSVGDLSYKIMGDKEVGVIGSAKATDTLTIPSSVTISGKVYKVTSIQEKAFYRNEDIVNVTIGNNVTYVGKYTFYQCPSLETVKFGKRVSTISTCAFTQCPNLEDVTLPASVKRLGAKAFYQCTSIETLKINSSALEYVGKKGLAVNKSVILQLPKKLFTKYQKLIKASNIYSKTKFVKF